MEDQLDHLNECLRRFKAEDVTDITEKYMYHPDYLTARLGSGSYGEAFRMKSVENHLEPLRVVKVIPKSRVSKNSLQIQHLCAELAVTGYFTHVNLNKRVGLFHNSQNIFIALELVEGRPSDIQTRLAHLYAYYHPARLAGIEAELESLSLEAQEKGFQGSELGAYVEQSGRLRTILAECAAKKEAPNAGDLFSLIVALKRIPDGLTKIIIKQALLGLRFLHESNVVHRDVKTENLVLGVSRSSQVLRTEDGKITGVKFIEEVHAKVIDFGLVKYMKLGALPNVMSPGMFNPQAPSQSLAGLAAAGGGLDFDDDDNGGAGAFGVDVTPCGTELYCSLEVIDGILKSGVGRSKWKSDSANLPKMDVYGVGTMMFCCANGRPPYRPPRDVYRPVSREERIKQVQRLIAAGPVFSANVAPDTQDFIRWLMHNDPAQRPSAAQALAHPYLAGVTNRYVYTVNLAGQITPISEVTPPLPTTSTATSETDDDVDEDGHGEDDIMAAVRGIEDAGDVAGKDRRE